MKALVGAHTFYTKLYFYEHLYKKYLMQTSFALLSSNYYALSNYLLDLQTISDYKKNRLCWYNIL